MLYAHVRHRIAHAAKGTEAAAWRNRRGADRGGRAPGAWRVARGAGAGAGRGRGARARAHGPAEAKGRPPAGGVAPESRAHGFSPVGSWWGVIRLRAWEGRIQRVEETCEETVRWGLGG